jgi:FixJ family two-component response regulator
MHDQSETIVVVEDDAGVSKAIERLLRAGGFQSLSFASAEALLDSDAISCAACLVLDIHLPGESGFDLRRHLTALGHEQPVIFITAQDDDASRSEASQLNCIAYFRKPFEGAALLDAIRRALGACP